MADDGAFENLGYGYAEEAAAGIRRDIRTKGGARGSVMVSYGRHFFDSSVSSSDSP